MEILIDVLRIWFLICFVSVFLMFAAAIWFDKW